jgi:hypothetical protein
VYPCGTYARGLETKRVKKTHMDDSFTHQAKDRTLGPQIHALAFLCKNSTWTNNLHPMIPSLDTIYGLELLDPIAS